MKIDKANIKAMADEIVQMTLEDALRNDMEHPTLKTRLILGIFKTAEITGIDYYTYHRTENGNKVFVELIA